MQTIIDLWNGNIAPVEHCGSHNVELNRLLGLMERHRKNLGAGLTAAQTEILEKYIECADEYQLRMLELAFCDGFTVGCNLMVEAIK